MTFGRDQMGRTITAWRLRWLASGADDDALTKSSPALRANRCRFGCYDEEVADETKARRSGVRAEQVVGRPHERLRHDRVVGDHNIR